ncbi:MAG: NAD(P)/FAD-dependent oxidoreductase [Paludibacteraceae bacterium]|nr:NAD(P)/FAD-dependent oxidoreductase [Paludibacteraceae bacterium]
MKNVIVIGAGLSGLTVSHLLAKSGNQVTLLEQAGHVGGCLCSFCQNDIRFETGFHFVSGLTRFTPVYRLFRRLGLTRLPWQELKEIEVHIGSATYCLPCSIRQCKRYLTHLFPEQKENLKTYFNTLDTIAHCSLKQTLPYWERNAWEWLQTTITNPELINVLSSMSLIIDLRKQSLPLFSYAEIMWGILSSTKRLRGGGQTLIERLENNAKKAGVRILCHATVTQILESETGVTGVQLSDGQCLSADTVVSSLHPHNTISLLGDNTHIRKIYARRISNLPSTPGCFTVNVQLRKDALQLPLHPIYVHEDDSLWDEVSNNRHLMLYTYPEQDALDILMPMTWQQVEQWKDAPHQHRGADYEAFKQQMAKHCFLLAEKALPHLREYIVSYNCSTPLTWQHYTHTFEGSAYGTYKDCRSIETTLLAPKTPLQGLFLTGQSLVQHGIVGTAISAYFTASMIDPKLKIKL